MIPGSSVSKPGRQDRMRLRRRPSAARAPAARRISFSVFSIALTPPPSRPACTARWRVEACASTPSTSMRKWTSPPSAAHSRSSVGSTRDGHVGRRRALDDLARAVADDLLVADDVEDDVAARARGPASSADLRRPHRGREAALHVRRAAPVEPAVVDLAAERVRATTSARSPTGTTSTCALNASERPPPEPGRRGDDQRVRGEGRRRARRPSSRARSRGRRRKSPTKPMQRRASSGKCVASFAWLSVRNAIRSRSRPCSPSSEAATASTTAARSTTRYEAPASTSVASAPTPARRGAGCGRRRRTRARARRRSAASRCRPAARGASGSVRTWTVVPPASTVR